MELPEGPSKEPEKAREFDLCHSMTDCSKGGEQTFFTVVATFTATICPKPDLQVVFVPSKKLVQLWSLFPRASPDLGQILNSRLMI